MRSGDPRWTARDEESEGAQDPLAMNRVTDRLLRALLPGITTISPRPRYIAHHLWALDNATKENNPESHAQLMQELYRRERILLLSGARHKQSDTNKQHTNIVGARTGNKLVAGEDESISLDFSFSSNRSGSYGRNYVGPLQKMGLVDTPDDNEFEEPTERGQLIADAYDTVAQSTNLPELASAERITYDQLDRIAPELCPCAVSTDTAPDREPLRDLYLGRDSPEKFASQARDRRESLALILHIARLGNNSVSLRPRSLVNACYYGIVLGDDGPVQADLPVELEETAARWKVLRAHDYFSYATEALLTSWLAYLKRTEEADASLEEFKQQAKSETVYERMEEHIDHPSLTSETQLSAVLSSTWPDATSTAFHDGAPVTPVSITHNASEYSLDEKLQRAVSNQDWTEVHATWPSLLLALSLRFVAPSGTDEAAWTWLRSQTKGDLSPVRFHDHLIVHLEKEYSLGDFIDWFIDQYLITRANEIAAGKSDGLSASRGYFEQTTTGWRHVRDHKPSHWSARFDSAVSVLRDLALLDPDSSKTALTPSGMELLQSAQEGTANAN